MAALGEAGIRDYTKTIGLFRNRAQNTFALLGMLHDHFENTAPFAGKSLMSPPGGRRKSGNVIMWEPSVKATLVFHTNMFRPGNRTGLAPRRTVLDIEKSKKTWHLNPIVCLPLML